MHILITLAGHSRRFNAAGYQGPKFKLDIDGRSMLERVISMFAATDSFHFVVNERQVVEDSDLESWLQALAPNVTVATVPTHEFGPVYTALAVKDIPSDEPVIISYCDFSVEWNYEAFKREIHGWDAAIPAFKGVHPASFGNTFYAYMRVNEDNQMLELREKNSFTANRHEEFASAGIYYFKSWRLFKNYAEKLLATGFGELAEGYVSLLANMLVDDQLKVLVTEVKRFICWGTPEDLEQYEFWSRYYASKLKNDGGGLPAVNENQINLIPMAGAGSRFKRDGYRTSKPLIIVGKEPMLIAACHSFPTPQSWIFLARAMDLQRHPIEQAVGESLNEQCLVVPVFSDTSGQAATCLLAKTHLQVGAQLFIASCDYETIYSPEAWQDIVEDESICAAIWTTKLGANLTKDPEAFGYCITSESSNDVVEIVEKQTISDDPGKDPLIVGSFWFRNAGDFIDVAEQAIAENRNINGEHYVANAMNILLEQNKRVVTFDVDQWISFGDPFELEIYYYWTEYFYELHNSGRWRGQN